MEKISLFLPACLLVLLSCGQGGNTVHTRYTPKETRLYYQMGSSKKVIVILSYGDRKDITMLNLHDDETTSVNAAKKVLEETGGLLIRLENNNERLAGFVKNQRKFLFDPNRIFTRTGVKATLQRFNRQDPEFAIRSVEGFGKFILDKIPGEVTTLIALHNNDEGKFSIHSFLPGGEYQADTEQAGLAQNQDPDNFFLTTDVALYRNLKGGYNAVLQENDKARDDGSLSIYYGRRNRSYVNVEVEAGQLVQQEKMLRDLLQLIIKDPL